MVMIMIIITVIFLWAACAHEIQIKVILPAA